MRTYIYPAPFEPGETPGVIVVSFPDIPGAITRATTRDGRRGAGHEAH